ncbi:ABC transporter permease [Niabella aurantiaca]|uniref:ABC transporter permease n=1 Tax=Niabella aurantiaca TaxID=379900 RepID=UPI000367B3D4|nr:ABC transporter permease [Niabella aurantiaca]
MFKNYFRTAWRQLNRNRLFALVNIFGLALGLTAFWLIALFIADELSFDRYHEKADRIYRVVSHGRWQGGGFDITGTSGPLAQAMKDNFPEIEQTVRINAEGGGVIRYKDKKLKEDTILFTDKSFFHIFSHRFLAGDPSGALARPRSIVLTKTVAEKLFTNWENAVGKTIFFENNFPNLVTGVIEDVPRNSHFTFSGLRSFDDNYTTDPGNFMLYTYLLLKPGASSKNLISKLPAFSAKMFPDTTGKVKYNLELQPVTSIHLHSDLSYELGENRSVKFIYIVGAIAILILIIALINYVNITTARSSVRLKEVAIRKIVGSSKRHLIGLFLIESVVTALLASCISILLAIALMPWFNALNGKQLELFHFGTGYTILALSGVSLLLGSIGGLYPALLLSAFRVIPSLRNQMVGKNGQALFRKGLVVFQFAVTVTLIAVSMLVYKQLKYVLHKDLGLNKNQVLTFHIDRLDTRRKIGRLEESLRQNPDIKGVAVAGNPIGNNDIGMLDYSPEINGVVDPRATNLGYGLQVDASFIPTLEIGLLNGRNFVEGSATDSQSVLVNETLVKKAGWKSPVGMQIQVGGPGLKTVIGVVRDFHIYSLQHKIEPMVLLLPGKNEDKDNVYVRIGTDHMKATIAFIESTFKQMDADALFSYHFLDDNFARQYVKEERQGNVLLGFTILAIVIACLGLFALITFTAGQQVKELGIRKVLGASVASLVRLVSFYLLKWICLSLLIAFPVSYIVMNKWLDDFAYRTSVSWWLFVLAGLIALVIAFATISVQAVRAATANPVKALRSE